MESGQERNQVHARRGGTITVRSRDEGGRLVIEVADTGIGIGSKDLSRIFDAFEQVEDPRTRKYGGLGLGLAISRSIAEAHGGMLTVRSRGRDRGTTFMFALPVAASEAAGPVPTPTVHPEPEQHSLNLLVVEDDDMTLRVMGKILRGMGHSVTTAATMADALVAAAPEFDLVISDLGLPDGSGLELMRRLKERYGVSGIALTGFGAEEDITESREAGFVSHLTKPVDFSRLASAIRESAIISKTSLVGMVLAL